MSAYYNEYDRKAAAWLRELIKQGFIADGDVDERSICDIKPEELSGYTQCHFFAGIGGWSLALRLAGWPDDKPVWTGSCPCQPYSNAGKGEGNADPRNLWPVLFNLIRECRPNVCFGEQVESAVRHGWLDGISTDLESQGYACGAVVLGAHSVGAPHIRQRLYWVAYAEHSERRPFDLDREHEFNGSYEGRQETYRESRARGEVCGMGNAEGEGSSHGGNGTILAEPSTDGGGSGMGDAERDGLRASRGTTTDEPDQSGHWSLFDIIPCLDGKARRVEPGSFPLAHGIPGRVGLLRGYGNAIVPEVAAQFIQAFVAEKGGCVV